MSYARFTKGSDVYVFAHRGGFIQCCGCWLGPNWDLHSAEDVVAHLQEHVAAGHNVPSDLLDVSLYDADDFIAMCDVFMCREKVDHLGEHTPITHGDIERFEDIRNRQVGATP